MRAIERQKRPWGQNRNLRVAALLGTSLLLMQITLPPVHGSANKSRTRAEAVFLNPSPAAYLQKVNAGGPAYSANGESWAADRAYTAGSWGYVGSGGTYTTTDPIANTTDDLLY